MVLALRAINRPGRRGGPIPPPASYYFIGKDNIFFHTAHWPAELKGAVTQFGEIFSAGRHTRLTCRTMCPPINL